MIWLVSLPALAHIALQDPQPRYPSNGNNNNKACPCGVGESNRLCNVASDRSDPDRNDARASTFVAGQTITLHFDETIGHAGRYRVAFDPDGADMDDFNDHILLDVPDPSGSAGNAGGISWELTVTLPNTPCDNCTLQLVQMMDGNTVDPVPDPIGRSSYYQCVDLVLTEGDIPPDPTDTDDPVPPTPVDTDDPAPQDTDPDPSGDTDVLDADGGCGCRTSSAPTGLLALVGLVGLRRRR